VIVTFAAENTLESVLSARITPWKPPESVVNWRSMVSVPSVSRATNRRPDRSRPVSGVIHGVSERWDAAVAEPIHADHDRPAPLVNVLEPGPCRQDPNVARLTVGGRRRRQREERGGDEEEASSSGRMADSTQRGPTVATGG
jgi:hypothetical protein